MRHPHRLPPILLVLSVSAVALAGCSTASSPEATSAPVASTSAPAVSPSASASSGGSAGAGVSGSCGTDDAAAAVKRAVASLAPPIPSVPSARWDASSADVSGFDPCAALSWALVGVVDGTPSSPNAILLFHDGAYLGTATAEQYPFEPTITRRSDDAIDVTYRYATSTDANANPTGTAQAGYRWDASTDKVVMSGTVPPTP